MLLYTGRCVEILGIFFFVCIFFLINKIVVYILDWFKESVFLRCGGCRLVYNGPRAAEMIVFIFGVFCLFCFL